MLYVQCFVAPGRDMAIKQIHFSPSAIGWWGIVIIPVRPSARLPVCLSVRLYVRPSVRPSVTKPR